jgi:hypothetical protein
MRSPIPDPENLQKIRDLALAYAEAERCRDADPDQVMGASRAREDLKALLFKSGACYPTGHPEEKASILRVLCNMYDTSVRVGAQFPRVPSQIPDFKRRVERLGDPPGNLPAEVRKQKPRDKSSRPTIASLQAQGFQRVTIEFMVDHWHIGRKTLAVMARRAAAEGHIEPGYHVLPTKPPQLWARSKSPP